MSDQLLDSLRELIAEWRKVAADPNAATEALYGDVLDACADDLEEKLRGCCEVAA